MVVSFQSLAQTPDTVFLEELTWTEVRAAIDSGATTVIVPTAGTEQNGPHMALGKHKYRINAGSDRIARELGNALVAPVMTYVPEGNIDPPSGHMRYAGAISLPQDVFRSVLEYAARSMRAHGFTDILFIGDSGGNQSGMRAVAETLNDEWNAERTRVLVVTDWYGADDYPNWLLSQGFSDEEIGSHAGLSDTAKLLYVAPQHVRTELLVDGDLANVEGVSGDPSKATAELGKVGMDFHHESAMRQINQLMAED